MALGARARAGPDRPIPSARTPAPAAALTHELAAAVYTGLPLASAVIGLDGRILQANAAFGELSRYEPEALRGMFFLSLMQPDLREQAMADLAALLAGSVETTVQQGYLRRRDRTLVQVRAHVQLLRDREGAAWALVGVVFDASEQLAVEQLDRSRALAELSRVVAQAGVDTGAALSALGEAACRHAADVATVRLLTDDRRWFAPSSVCHADPAVAELLTATLGVRRFRACGELGIVLGGEAHRYSVPAGFLETLVTGEQWDTLQAYEVTHGVHLPLTVRGEVIGMLDVGRVAGREGFSEADVAFLLSLSERCALAVDNARLLAAAQAELAQRRDAETAVSIQLDRQASVSDLGRLALSGADLTTLLAEAAAVVGAALGCDLVEVLEARQHAPDLVRRTLWRHSDLAAASHQPAGTGSPSGLLLAALHTASAVAAGGDDPRLHALGLASGLAICVDAVHKPFGVVLAGSAVERDWTSDEVMLLETVAHVLAGAVRQQRSASDLRRLALHDTLTELPNRTMLLDRLVAALRRVPRPGHCVALLVLDLDRFKLVNDGLGHAAGDELLVRMGRRLRRALGREDTVGRLGGDEFVLLLESLPIEQADRLAESMVTLVRQPVALPDGEVLPSASVGLVVHQPAQAPLREEAARLLAGELLRDGDAAMYAAKERGRNQVVRFDAALRARNLRQITTERALRRAVSTGTGLSLAYQPIVELSTGAMVGVEALLRWDAPSGAASSPGEFIPLAEETGLVIPLSDWVLRTAATQAQRWNAGRAAAGRHRLVVGVNLSPRQFAENDLVQTVANLLAEHGCDATWINIEITEGALATDVEAAVRTVHGLRELGVAISIDDFGTGYSSLSQLKHFPVTDLKIDRSFVTGLGTDSDDSAIAATVVTLAERLGMRTVAEGVETPGQLAELVRLGVTTVQGYLLGRPAPATTAQSIITAADHGEPPWSGVLTACDQPGSEGRRTATVAP